MSHCFILSGKLYGYILVLNIKDENNLRFSPWCSGEQTLPDLQRGSRIGPENGSECPAQAKHLFFSSLYIQAGRTLGGNTVVKRAENWSLANGFKSQSYHIPLWRSARCLALWSIVMEETIFPLSTLNSCSPKEALTWTAERPWLIKYYITFLKRQRLNNLSLVSRSYRSNPATKGCLSCTLGQIQAIAVGGPEF